MTGGLETTTIAGDGRTRDDAGALLVVGEGHLSITRFAGDALVIGRAAGCDVVIDHRALSRRHAVVRRAPALTVQDLGSTNGTRVGDRVHTGGDPVPLAVGAGFFIGPFSFVVVSGAASAPSPRRTGADRLVIDDPSQDGVTPLVREIARAGVNVLIQGETGAGKEVLATTLHALSGRTGPFARINCAALSESLLESELFGHEKGAFTGAVAARAGLLEDAARGTVFLDEIGELPAPIQAKLLRAIEAREVVRLGSTRPVAIDVRFVAATNRDLPAEVAAGRFREDLFFRLDGVTLRVAPLRERPGRIAALARRFLDEAGARLGRGPVQAGPDVHAALAAHPWPGNVRELRAVIDRAVLLAGGSAIGARHLAFAPRPRDENAAPPPAAAVATPAAAPAHPTDDLSDFTPAQRDERARIVAALAACVGNQTRAARQLGMSRSTLVTKMVLYRIPRPRV